MLTCMTPNILDLLYRKFRIKYHKIEVNTSIPFSHKIPAVGLVGLFAFSWYFLRFTMIFFDPRNKKSYLGNLRFKQSISGVDNWLLVFITKRNGKFA